jgi:hypothetical protein
VRWVTSVSCGVALVGLTGVARAASPLTLSWSAPAECPSEADVVAAVDERLGGSTSKAPVDAKATVTRRRDGTWQVVLSTDQAGTAGERTLAGQTCASVASATALILALTIDPEVLSRPPPPPRVVVPEPPPDKPPPPPPAPAVERRPRLYMRLTPTLGLGVLANVASAGAGVAFGALAGRLSVELTAYAFIPESHDSARAGAGGTFWLLAIGGSVCGAVVDSSRLRLGGCGGFEVQGIHGWGYGVSDPRSAVSGFGAPTASLVAALHAVSALWLTARVDGIVALSHPTFVLDGIGPVFQVSAVSARVSLGVELRF